jgi:archaellum component FlaC
MILRVSGWDNNVMDRAIDGNLDLFDALLQVLSKHEGNASVEGIRQDLKSARFNYTQRDVRHLVNNLCRALHSLMDESLDESLKAELKNEVRARATAVVLAAEKLRELADEYEAKGGKLLTHDEILAEVAERRGGFR